MTTIYLEYILAYRLSAIGEGSIKETDLMDQVWKDLTAAIDRGDSIDVPYRREPEGIRRITGVVEVLRLWVRRGIIECFEEDNKDVTFKVLRPIILSLTLSEYQDFSRGGSENGSD